MATIIRRRRLGMSSAKGITEFSKTGIKWVRSDKPLPEDELYIRWGCTANVPAKNVLNTAQAIHEVNDKSTFRVKLSDAKLSPPSAIIATMRNKLGVELGMEYPIVIRPRKHAQGRNIYLCNNPEEARAAVKKCGDDGYASNFVDKVKEYRVAVVQGRAVWVAEKTPGNKDDLAWNVAKGGRFDNVRWDAWPLKVVRVAIEGFNLSTLDFGGVDVMVDKDGNATILEINSAPSLTSPYRQECFAKAFDWIINNDKNRIPLVEARGGYSKFIHPALTDKALIGEAV